MKHVQFDYVNSFSCLAGACPNTCCKDWQIILDCDAIARYASLPGELGEQVQAAMVTENGETRFREQDGKCVLLRKDGLCPLQAAYGAEMLCRTCFTHPRFTEEYGQTAELTLSASCPEAARLLLEHDAPLTLTETDDGGPVVPNDLDPELYPALFAARAASIRLAQDRTRPIADRLALILLLVCALCFAVHILVIDHFTAYCDGVKLSCLQFLFAALISTVCMFLFEDVDFAAIWGCILPLLYVGIFSCGVGYTLQILAQKGSNPTVVTILLSLESVFAVIAGAIILKQQMSAREYIGCAVMFAAVLLAQIDFPVKQKAE